MPSITGSGGRVVSIQNNGPASCPAIIYLHQNLPRKHKHYSESVQMQRRREPITGCGSQVGKYTEQRASQLSGNYYLHQNLPRKHKHYYTSVQRHGARQLDKDVRIILLLYESFFPLASFFSCLFFSLLLSVEK
jgi:hypothetical protein